MGFPESISHLASAEQLLVIHLNVITFFPPLLRSVVLEEIVHVHRSSTVCPKDPKITHFKAGMCLFEYIWYFPSSLNQHMYIYTLKKGSFPSVFLSLKGAGSSHRSFYEPGRFYLGSEMTEKRNS